MTVKQVQVLEKKSIGQWNKFVIENTSPASFLQAWEWGKFRQQKLGEVILRLVVEEDNKIIAIAQLVKRSLPGRRFYLSCPRGPVIKFQISNFKFQKKIFNLIINEIKKIDRKEKIIFFRIETPYKKDKDNKLSLIDNNLIKPKILVNLEEPKNTLILDLTKSEEKILQAMHHKTRYNIRVAERKGIKIKDYSSGTKQKEVDIFYSLLQQTAKRDKIKVFNKGYYKALINYFGQTSIGVKQPIIRLFVAEYKGKTLAAIIVVGFGDTATYLHGASSDEHRNLMPNYMLQWQAIKWAKKQGYKFYDFWGIAPVGAGGKDAWAGITRFKRGFVGQETGQEINYLGAFDFVLNKTWYGLYKIGKILRP